MPKKNYSWSKVEGIENLIGRKRVDFSMFNYGVHIPKEYYDDFLELIPGHYIDQGTSKEITLEFEDRNFDVRIINILNKDYSGDTIQIRYESNKELIDYLKGKFKTSFTYIDRHRDGNGKKNKITVPEELAEYMEFYKTDKMLHYKIQLITKDVDIGVSSDSMKYEFFKYIGPKGVLNNSKYQKSYKLILLLNLLNLVDEEGKANYQDVCESICQMYLARHRAGFLVEQNDSRIQREAETLNKNIVKNVMDENAYKVIQDKGYIHKKYIDDIEYICFNETLWKDLGESDIKKLRDILKDKMERYYRERVEKTVTSSTLKSYFEKIMNEYENARMHEAFAGHELGNLIRRTIPEYLLERLSFVAENEYQITGSIGQGNWAKVPWIALMNKKITTTTQKGIYIVYLFSEDMKRLYLTLIQGVTDVKGEYGRSEGMKVLIERAKTIRKQIDMANISAHNDIHVSEGNLGLMYQAGTIGFIEYERSNIPNDNELIEDLESMVTCYEDYIKIMEGGEEMDSTETNYSPLEYIQHIYKYITNQGFTYDMDMIKNFYLSLKTKPFVLLAGISGTGKSKLVELFAESIGATSENGRYTIIPVRPDWSDPSDLLGYRNIEGKFQPGPLTMIIKGAIENPKSPYFVCLDEMNLARVEYYFSDVLSIMETRKRKKGIKTDIILKKEMFGDDEESRAAYGELYIPENLYIIGTVNMDETTFPFSKKVLDRANTIEFNKVKLSIDFDLLGETTEDLEQTFMDNEKLCSQYLKLMDCVEYREIIEKTIYILEEINRILEKEGLHFGYRVRDEVIFYLLYGVNADIMLFDQAMDHAIIQKILPRIQGSNFSTKELLIQLFLYFVQNRGLKYNPMDNDNWAKMDKYISENKVKYPLSAEKVAKMVRRYDMDGFTTFWE